MSIHHHEPQAPNACVPACMGMIQMRRGLPPTEAAFQRDASPKGYGLASVCALERVTVSFRYAVHDP